MKLLQNKFLEEVTNSYLMQKFFLKNIFLGENIFSKKITTPNT